MTNPINASKAAGPLASLPCDGGCTCGHVRYRLSAKPLIVHGCHCSLCQRQTGSAFAINALVEADSVQVLSGEIDVIKVATPSNQGQIIARCAKCRVAVWSCYLIHELKEGIRFLRVGTLDDPNLFPPDVHIFTADKQEWINVPNDAPQVPRFYKIDETWSPDSLARRKKLLDTAGIATSG